MINSLVNHPKISLHTWATAQQAREKESEVLVTQSCLTLCNPIDCSSPGSSVHGISQTRILEKGCHFLLQGIFLTQRLNPHLLHLLYGEGKIQPGLLS